ncbi:MAG: hypothetical protein Unbinned6747contig1000_40 [Prokaryotic dsDNA virus sp.]|nr:MAG: hypothetical protein Unbinned6747contig1000_40 [Prokaryotic dsDNA virus sp.]|tara:strand:+ start:6364 stop:8271 length:1908 start_codon:yes stop_codon:yes gene_type:complete
MAIKDLLIRLGVKGDKKAKTKIKGVENGLGNLGKSAMKAGAAFFGARALIDGMKQSINLAGIQEQAEKRLEVALGKRSKALLDQASALQQQTTFGDEAIIGVQASIGAFVKSEEQIKKATSATLDMAVAMGMDLKASGDLIAKTLGSSTNALSRYGIEVSGAVGSTERLESLTNNIAKLFGGQASAQAQTFAGSIDQMKNAIGDTGEQLGMLFQPAVESSAKALKTFSEDFGKTIKAIRGVDLQKTGQNFLKSTDALMKAIKATFKVYVDLYPDMFKKALSNFGTIAKNVFFGFLALVKEVALTCWEPLFVSVVHIGERIKEAFANIINKGILTPLQFLTEKINEVGSFLGFEDIKPFNLLKVVEVDPLLDKLKETKIGEWITPGEDDVDTLSEALEKSGEIWTEYLEEISVLKDEEKATDLEAHIKNEQDKANETKKSMMQLTKDEKAKIATFKQTFDAAVGFAKSLDAYRKQLRDNEMNAEIQAILKSQMTEEQKESAIANIKERFRQKDIQAARKMKSVKKAEAIINTAVEVTKHLSNPVAAGLIAAKGAAEVAIIEAQQFAKGGIVQGYGDQDTVPAMLTPGELILNQAQQDNLANNMGGVTVNIGGNIIGEESFVRDTLIPEIEKARILA